MTSLDVWLNVAVPVLIVSGAALILFVVLED